MQQNQQHNDRSIGSFQKGIPPQPPGPPPSRYDMGSSSSMSAGYQFGRNSRSNQGGGRNTLMMSRSNIPTIGAQSADLYRTVFPEPGAPYLGARCETDSQADAVCAGGNFIPLFHHGT
jgi:hypothetical protein